MDAKLLPIDMRYVQDLLLRLLATPSPSGRTDEVMHLIGAELERFGIPFVLTRRGALVADLSGEQDSPDRAIAVHADTTGCLVRGIRDDGRLEVTPVGHFSSRFAEGARVRILTDDPDRGYTGTILPLLSSGHRFGNAVDNQPTSWDDVEVRVDELVESSADSEALGIRVGDFVALEPQPEVSESGYVKSRHLDDKAGIAAAFGALKAVIDHDVQLPVSVHFLVTIAEEVGLGASHGLHADVAEMVAIDNAVVAPGQSSRETTVNIAMLDSSGPFDYHLTRKLLRLCEELDIDHRRDVFRHYRSDNAAALEAGAETRTALIGTGVDASHGHERTHLDGIRRAGELVAAYLQTPLTFASDETPRVPLEEFPHQDQPADGLV